jgi:hypothetical protein
MPSSRSSFLFGVVVVSLAIALIGAVVAPILLLLHVEAFPLYALSGAAYVFAIVIGGQSVLREEDGEARSPESLRVRRATIAVRIVSGISFLVAALHAWSEEFPWLQGPYVAVTDVALSLGIIAVAGELLWRTLRRARAVTITMRVDGQQS